MNNLKFENWKKELIQQEYENDQKLFNSNLQNYYLLEV